MVFNFFKKSKQKSSEEIKDIDVIEFRKIMMEKEEKTSIREEEINHNIKQLITDFLKNINEKNNALKEIDFENIKERERIKSIVKENLTNYIILVERLEKKISEVKDEPDIISSINEIFTTFKKKSRVNYEKATYLIGKEIGAIDEEIKSFFNSLNSLLKENEKDLSEVKNVKTSIEMLRLLDGKIKQRENVKDSIQELHDSIQKQNNGIRLLHDKKQRIKNSDDFIKNDENIQKKETLAKEIEYDLLKIKQQIDFKKLTSIHHSSKKDLEIITMYKENFLKSYNDNRLDKLVSFLHDSNLYTTTIKELIEKLELKEKKVSSLNIKENWFGDIDTEISTTQENINNLEKEEQIIQKQVESIDEEIEDCKKNITRLATQFNVHITFK